MEFPVTPKTGFFLDQMKKDQNHEQDPYNNIILYYFILFLKLSFVYR